MALVEFQAADGVATLTLTSPPANCYTHEMMRELDEAILKARFDDSVHVILLSGAGEKHFCAGADIGMLKAATARLKYNFCLHANETLCRLEQTPKLVIAAIHGTCVGGGLEIAMAADLRIARKGPGKLGLPEVTLGLMPGNGGTQRLSRIVGKSAAIELMSSGRLFEVEEALQRGIVNSVIDAPDRASFLGKVLEVARGYCPPHKASRAVGLIKRAVQSGSELDLHDALVLERELQQQLFESEDAREGLGAFLEKRNPAFRGR